MTYDLAVAYRIYPKVSRVAPVFSDDKLKLAEFCLRSFQRALGDMRVKIYAILDGCPPEFQRLFEAYFAKSSLQTIEVGGIGNRPTFGRQIEVLLSQADSDLVYFAEDDYFYRAGSLVQMVNFLRGNSDAHFITPYDHPDTYQLPLHPKRQETRTFGGAQWRTCASTCLTFLTTTSVLRRTEAIFRTYEATNLDVSLWFALTKQTALNPVSFLRCCLYKINYGGYIVQSWRYGARQLLLGPKWKLWRAIPSMATHMVSGLLAPGIDWAEEFKTSNSRRAGTA